MDATSFRTAQAPQAPVGTLPSQRIPTQVVPPACVQNAMMTKDKKPFTYTPGGIDLSEIKSPRMAKRLAKNAQYEGVTGQPKQSPLANPNNPPAPPMAASALGMPVQVFPTGPAKPLQPAGSAGAPPPPPPPSKSQLTPQSNGNAARKSPSPSQNFEPPPMGCRPEIKIPPNPMATLKKVPKPQPKNDFWIEEYRKERSKSPLVSDGNGNASPPQQEQTFSPQSSVKPDLSPKPNEQFSRPNTEINRPVQQPQSPIQQQPQYRAQSPPKQNTQIQQQRSIPVQQRASSPSRNPAGYYQQQQPNQQRIESPFQSRDSPSLQRPLSPVKMAAGKQESQPQIQPHFYRQPPQSPMANPITPPIQQNRPAQVGSLYIQPVAPENLATNRQQQQQQQQPQQPQQPQQQQRQQQPQQQQQQQPQQQQQQKQQQQQQQSQPQVQAPIQQQQRPVVSPPGSAQTPAWLATRPSVKEVPEWIRENNTPPATRRIQSPPIATEQTGTGQRPGLAPLKTPAPNATSNNSPGQRPPLSPLIATSPNAKERIIPIQIEQSPTKTPSTPAFGPQPYYTANQQFSSVPSPAAAYNSPNAAFAPNQGARNPNQFVDQGYNNYPNQWQSQQQRVTSPPVGQQSPQSAGGTRIIPIAIEGQDPFNPNVRGPISQTPTVLQNGNSRYIIYDCPLEAELRYRKSRLSDPRTLQHQQSWGNGAPNQSKSFRVLQKITDTDQSKENKDVEETSAQLQRPQYSRQMGAGSNDPFPPNDQMRRMQLNEQDQAMINRVKNQVDQEYYLHNEEDPRYRGSAIPSKSFQILQNMTNHGWDDYHQYQYAPMQRQPQRFVQQVPMYQSEDQSQQQPYIHPSEQQVPEPKKYTGSAIPSRSFKILQAMTTPENAGPGQSDL